MADRNASGIFTRSCLVAAAVVVVLLVVMIAGLAISGSKAIERERAARVAAQFNDAKGRSSAHVTFDAEPIKMLAEDKESAEMLVELYLSSINFRDLDMQVASKLSNVKTIHSYSCTDIENFLSAMQESPALEELSFDTTTLSDEGVKLLATFPNLKKVRFNYVAEQERVDLLKSTIPHVTLEIDETE